MNEQCDCQGGWICPKCANEMRQLKADLRKLVERWRQRSVDVLEVGSLLNRAGEYRMSSRAATACADELDKLLER